MFSDFDTTLPEVAVQRAVDDAQQFDDVVHAHASLANHDLVLSALAMEAGDTFYVFD